MDKLQHTRLAHRETRTLTRKVAPQSTLNCGIHQAYKKESVTALAGKNGRMADPLFARPDWTYDQSSAGLKSKFYFHSLVTTLVLMSLLIGISKVDVSALSSSHLGIILLMAVNMISVRRMSSHINQLKQENESAVADMMKYLAIAETDCLTGLPNRLALKQNLANLPSCGSLTFIDIDGLKYYNDRFGHARGDELLRFFSLALAKHLSGHAQLHRLGGDEFAITCATGEVAWVEQMLRLTVADMNANGFELVDASCGSAFAHETADKAALQHLADCRMYATKRLHKSVRHLNA